MNKVGGEVLADGGSKWLLRCGGKALVKSSRAAKELPRGGGAVRGRRKEAGRGWQRGAIVGVVNTQWGKPNLLGLEQSDETRREANSRARPTQDHARRSR